MIRVEKMRLAVTIRATETRYRLHAVVLAKDGRPLMLPSTHVVGQPNIYQLGVCAQVINMPVQGLLIATVSANPGTYTTRPERTADIEIVAAVQSQIAPSTDLYGCRSPAM